MQKSFETSAKSVPIMKIVTIGDSNVGKTALLTRYTDSSFTESHVLTIGNYLLNITYSFLSGVEFRMKPIDVEKKRITLHLWDTAGVERFSALTSSFYNKASGILLCYSISDRVSFERVTHWIVQVQQFARKDVCKLLVATKCDLKERRVSTEEGKALAERYGIKFIETSAKENKNVDEAFMAIAQEVKKSGLLYKEGEGDARHRLSSKAKIETEKGCC